jgi:puromycin-sensitive aminopeptidase
VNQTGLYRVQYSSSMLERLKKPIQEKVLNNVDRLSIIGDAFAVAICGRIPMADVFSVLQAYKGEHEYYVWSQISSNIGELNTLFSQESFAPQFKNFILSIFKPQFQQHFQGSWDSPEGNKDPLDSSLRAIFVSRLGGAKDPEVIAEAKKRFQAFLGGNQNALKSDVRFSAFKIVLENGGEKEFQDLLKLYRTTDSVEEKRRCLSVLGFVPDQKLINQFLDFILSDEVRKNEVTLALSSVGINPNGRYLAWEFVKRKWDDLYKMFGEGQFLLPGIIECSTQRFVTLEDAEDVLQFFETHPIPDAQRTIKQSLETIHNQAVFLQNQGTKISAWLKENGF